MVPLKSLPVPEPREYRRKVVRPTTPKNAHELKRKGARRGKGPGSNGANLRSSVRRISYV
jgi:hypothetical protein